MTEYDKQKGHISSKLNVIHITLIMLDRQPVTKTLITLHYTSPNYTSLHFIQQHFTKLHPTTLH